MTVTTSTALVFGGSGLVGSQLLETLVSDSYYNMIHIVVRSPISLNHPCCQVHCIDFDQLADYKDLFQVDDVYCCLGTTIKQAKTREQFRRVDYDYPVTIARLAQEAGVKQLAVVSSVGSDDRSKNFYLATKGELETYLKSLDGIKIYIFKPSMLLGKRLQFRFGEKLATVLFPLISPFLLGSLSRWNAIQASSVATAMIYALRQSSQTLEFYYDDMMALLITH
tara:strand:- start:744 stop:1415 length:672 start_codon:yes stop_codon:yes gene_type:complete